MNENPYQANQTPAEPAVSYGFVERSRVGDQEQIVLRYLAIHMWLRFPVIGAMVWGAMQSGQSQVALATAIFSWIALLLLGLPYWGINREIKRRMASQPVTVQGSRYSFTNPITYRWERIDS